MDGDIIEIPRYILDLELGQECRKAVRTVASVRYYVILSE
jgi:hypothetical protein